MELILHAEVHPTGPTETSLWCPTCLLPSATRYGYAMAWAETLNVFKFGSVVACDECGQILADDRFAP